MAPPTAQQPFAEAVRKALQDWRYTPLTRTDNLNCFIEGTDRETGYTFHVAPGDEPTSIRLSRDNDALLLERVSLPAPLEVGRAYRFAMTREGSAVRLEIDGQHDDQRTAGDMFHAGS